MVKFYVELFFGVAVGAFQEAPEKKKYKDWQSPSHCVPATFAQGSRVREIRESPLRMTGKSALLICFQPQRSEARIHESTAFYSRSEARIHGVANSRWKHKNCAIWMKNKKGAFISVRSVLAYMRDERKVPAEVIRQIAQFL